MFELVQALKFKTIIPDTNFLMLTNLVLQDAGGSVIEDIIGLSYQVMYFTVSIFKLCMTIIKGSRGSTVCPFTSVE